MKIIHSKSIATLLAGVVLTAGSVKPVNAFCVLDGTFNPGGSFTGGASALAVATQSDGKIIVGGYFTYNGNYPNGYPFTANNLVRFNTNGTVDTSFSANPNGIVRAVLVQPDDKIIIGGHFTQVAGLTQTYISRLTTSGYPDYIAFQAPAPNNYVYALGRKSDGQVILGGVFTTMAGSSYARIACLNTNGAIVSTFNPGVSGGTTPAVWAIAVHPTDTPSVDKIVLGGEFNTVGGYSRTNIARLNPCGCTDARFDTTTINPLNGPVYAVATDYGVFTTSGTGCPIEKVLIGGNFTGFGGGGGRNYFARLADAGYPDSNVAFGFTDALVNAIAVQSDHKIILGGAFTQAGGVTHNGVARLVPNTDLLGVDSSWSDCSPNGATNGSVVALTISSSGIVYAAGNFTHFEGSSRPKVARLLTTSP